MEKEIKLLVLCSLAVTVLLSCRKFVEPQVPADRIISSRVFTSEASATAAVNAIYGTMINGAPSFANALTTVYAGLSADELLRFNPPAADAEFAANTLSPSNATVGSIWRSAYQVIHYANAVIEGLENNTALSDTLKKRLAGEARLLRAFSYFYLLNFFGDVPLVTTTDFRVAATLPRSPVSEIYTLLVADLEEAQRGLPMGTDKTRPGRSAATALLARVHLYRKDWKGAEGAASNIISSGLYTPLPSLATAFQKGSGEAIWQLAPATGPLKESALFKPMGSPPAPQFFLSANTVKAFEPGDGRRTVWLDSLSYNGTRYHYPGKYKAVGAAVTEHYTVLRAAEAWLVRAEARLEQGKLPEAVADLNIVRLRAGLPPLLTTIGEPQVRAALEAERRSEFFAEWGHRWFDLNRWGKATAVLSPLKPAWQPWANLYPVPQDEILANPFLTQNGGY